MSAAVRSLDTTYIPLWDTVPTYTARSRVLKSLDGVAIEDTSIMIDEETETPPRTKKGYTELV